MDADALREKAHEHELNALSCEERGEIDAARDFAVVAIVLNELAEIEDREAA